MALLALERRMRLGCYKGLQQEGRQRVVLDKTRAELWGLQELQGLALESSHIAPGLRHLAVVFVRWSWAVRW